MSKIAKQTADSLENEPDLILISLQTFRKSCLKLLVACTAALMIFSFPFLNSAFSSFYKILFVEFLIVGIFGGMLFVAINRVYLQKVRKIIATFIAREMGLTYRKGQILPLARTIGHNILPRYDNVVNEYGYTLNSKEFSIYMQKLKLYCQKTPPAEHTKNKISSTQNVLVFDGVIVLVESKLFSKKIKEEIKNPNLSKASITGNEIVFLSSTKNDMFANHNFSQKISRSDIENTKSNIVKALNTVEELIEYALKTQSNEVSTQNTDK